MSIETVKAEIICDGCEEDWLEIDLSELYNGSWREDTEESLADINMAEWTRERQEDYKYRHFCPECTTALGKGHDD